MSEFWTLVILVSIYITFSFVEILLQDSLQEYIKCGFQPHYVHKEQVNTELH